MSQWSPNDPSPTPRGPSPEPSGLPPVETYDPNPEAPAQPAPPAPTESAAPPASPEAPAPPVDSPPPAPPVEAPAPAPAPPPEVPTPPVPPVPPPVDEAPAPSYNERDETADRNSDRDNYSDSALDGDIDETVFELNELALEARRHLEMRLTGAHIVHRWEVGSDLVVNTSDADAVEGFLDEVENPDAFELTELDAFDDDVDDEAVYKGMSDLYVAADRLQHSADDAATAGAFHLAADQIVNAPPPFGFDPRLWAQVKELTSSVVASLDADAEPDVVERDARTLRQILANYV